MTKLTDLHKAIHNMVSNEAVQKKIFDILRNDSRILLTPQRNQLFFKSQDADGKPLGFYTMHKDTAYHGTAEEFDREGQPFTMVDTGVFRRGIYQIVTSRAVYISSSAPHLEEMEANENNVFLSTKFFGITDDNMKNRVKPAILKVLGPWMVNYMKGLPIVT